MIENQDIFKKVKHSFESEHYEAPAFQELLDDHFDVLDDKLKTSFESTTYKAPSFNAMFDAAEFSIDKKVAESFESQDVILPSYIWNNIQNQLDVNWVWKNIEDKIKINTFSWRRVASIAAILTVFLSIPFNISNEAISVNYTELAVNLNSKIVEQSVTTNGILAQNGIDNFSNQTNKTDNLNGNLSPNSNVLEAGDEVPLVISENQSADINLTQDKKNDSFGKDQNMNQNLASINLNRDLLNISNPLPIDLIPNQDKLKSKPIAQFRVGLYGSTMSTWVIDEESKSSFLGNTLSSNKLAISSALGLQVDYNFNRNHGLSLYYILNSSSKGKIGFYEDNGFYAIKTKEIVYNQLALTYNFMSNYKTNVVDRNHVFGVGAYAGRKKTSSTYTNDVMTTFNSLYRDFDFGVKLSVGQQFHFGDVTVGTGLTSNIGLRNILNDSQSKATNFNFGGYANLSYNF